MREFFRGWKHKVGCVTLLLACVFIFWWVRSFSVQDMITLPLGQVTPRMLVSSPHHIVWLKFVGADIEDMSTVPAWKSTPISQTRISFENANIDWKFGLYGVCTRANDEIPLTLLFIPYPSIVIPLTLLSAWLLLSKPRSAKPVPKS